MRVIVYVPAGARSVDRVREELLQTALRDGFKREQIGFADTARQVYNAKAQFPQLVVYCRPRHRIHLVPQWVIAVGGAVVAWVYTRLRRRPRLATAVAATVVGVAAAAAVFLADDPEPPRFGAVSPPPPVVSPTTGGSGPTSTPTSAPTATAAQPSAGGTGGTVGPGLVSTADDQGDGGSGHEVRPTRTARPSPTRTAGGGASPPSAPPVTPPRSEPPATTPPAQPPAGQPEDDCLLGLDVSLRPILDINLCVGISRSADS